MAKAEVVTYEITALNGKERQLTFYDGELIKHTKAIQSYRDAGNLAILAIASELDAMQADGSYAKAGFKTVAEYAQVVFDYKPATVSLYLRSARAFIERTPEAKTPVAIKGSLPHITMGQMIELLPLVENETDISKVESMFVDGTINQRMSTKDIRKAVAAERGITAKTTEKAEKTQLEKAAKLGEYDKAKLPKGQTPLTYATTNITAALEAWDKFILALHDIEHGENVDILTAEVHTKMQEVLTAIQA